MDDEELGDFFVETTVEARDLVDKVEKSPYLKERNYPEEAERAKEYLFQLGNFYKGWEKNSGIDSGVNLEKKLLQDFKIYFSYLNRSKVDIESYTFAKESLVTHKGLRMFLGGLSGLLATGIYFASQDLKVVLGAAALLLGYKAFSAHQKVKLRKLAIYKYDKKVEENKEISSMDDNQLKKVLLERKADVVGCF